MNQQHQNQFRLVPYYLAIQATNGIYNCFITLYFNQRGYDNAQIGLLMSITPLAAMLAQPLLGYISDRVRYKKDVYKRQDTASAGAWRGIRSV